MKMSLVKKIILILLICLPGYTAGQVQANAAETGIAAQLLLEKINNARSNPLEAAAALGISEASLKAFRPGFYETIQGGMPLLMMAPGLMETAADHTAEMIASGRFSKDALSGETFEQRLDSAGYLPGTTGESVGILMFSNYINTADAVTLLFERLLRKEFDLTAVNDINILNPDFKYAGFEMGAGSFKTDRAAYNAYFLTCDFSEAGDAEVAAEAAYETLLLSLANQVRRRPFAAAAAIGIDLDNLMEEAPGVFDVWTNALPVLAPGEMTANLAYARARAFVEEMASAGISAESIPGGWMVERIAFDSEDVAGILAYRVMDAEAAEDDRATALHSLVRKLTVMDAQGGVSRPCLLAPFANEAGVSTGQWLIRTDDGGTAMLETVVMAIRTAPSPKRVLMLHAFYDRDGNGLYTPGEEASGLGLIIYSGSTPVGFLESTAVETDRFGVYSMPAPEGEVAIALAGEPDGSVIMPAGEEDSEWESICMEVN